MFTFLLSITPKYNLTGPLTNVKWASLAKWLGVPLRTKWFWVRVPLQSLNKLSYKANCNTFY